MPPSCPALSPQKEPQATQLLDQKKEDPNQGKLQVSDRLIENSPQFTVTYPFFREPGSAHSCWPSHEPLFTPQETSQCLLLLTQHSALPLPTPGEMPLALGPSQLPKPLWRAVTACPGHCCMISPPNHRYHKTRKKVILPRGPKGLPLLHNIGQTLIRCSTILIECVWHLLSTQSIFNDKR